MLLREGEALERRWRTGIFGWGPGVVPASRSRCRDNPWLD